MAFPFKGEQSKAVTATRDLKKKDLARIPEIDEKAIKYDKMVGRGNYGAVWSAEWHATQIAVKRPKESVEPEHERAHAYAYAHDEKAAAAAAGAAGRASRNSSNNNNNNRTSQVHEHLDALRKSLAYEAFIAMKLGSHPHVPNFHGAHLQGSNIFLGMQFIVRGSLDVLIAQHRSQGTTLSLRTYLMFLVDASAALVHLHANGVIHRDIASRNFLLRHEEGSEHLLICDFGLCLVLPSGKQFGLAPETDAIPVNITAPEALLFRIFSRATDVFQFGMLMWELWTCTTPFAALDAFEVGQLIVAGKRPAPPADMPRAVVALMESAWSQDPHARPDIESVNRTLRQLLDNDR